MVIKFIILILYSLFIQLPINSQESDGDVKISKNESPKFPNGIEISEKKRLNESDAKNKSEGWFPGGLPFMYNDPNNGVGYGARVIMTNNNTRQDPFFNYTPYRHRVFFHYSNTTKNAQWHSVDFDAPYFLDTSYRLRANFIYDSNPNNLYFGTSSKTLDSLSYQDRNEPGLPHVYNSSFDDQQSALAYRRPGREEDIRYMQEPQLNSGINKIGPQPAYVTDKKYNRYNMSQPIINISGERSFLRGLVRMVGGARLSKSEVKKYDGELYNAKDPVFGDTNFPFANVNTPTVNSTTKLTQDQLDGKILGYNGGYVNLARLGVVYDTRDFEPDPKKGMFLELTHERALTQLGSDYMFNKTYGSARFFYQILPKTFEKLVLATRNSFYNAKGNVPFFEYRNMWGTEGSVYGMGGRTTLRGFMQDRFIGPVMGWGNIELRWLAGTLRTSGGQSFGFNLAPFFDYGRVWDRNDQVGLKGYKYSYGLGLRVAWNLSTILYLDVAHSKENPMQVYLNFNNIF